MKKNLIFLGLWLSGLMLAGCSVVPPHVYDQYGSIAPLTAYFRYITTLSPELLAKEGVRAEQTFKDRRGTDERIKLAMLLGMLLPQEKRDEARAVRLLDGYINDNTVENEVLKDYVYGLRHLMAKRQETAERENALKERYNALEAEQKGLKERYSSLEAKLREETARSREEAARSREEAARNEDLQLKLNTLKAIEESIRRRTK